MPDRLGVKGHSFFAKIVALPKTAAPPKKRSALSPSKKSDKRSHKEHAATQEREDVLCCKDLSMPKQPLSMLETFTNVVEPPSSMPKTSTNATELLSSMPFAIARLSPPHGTSHGLDNLDDLIGQVLSNLAIAFDFDLPS